MTPKNLKLFILAALPGRPAPVHVKRTMGIKRTIGNIGRPPTRNLMCLIFKYSRKTSAGNDWMRNIFTWLMFIFRNIVTLRSQLKLQQTEKLLKYCDERTGRGSSWIPGRNLGEVKYTITKTWKILPAGWGTKLNEKCVRLTDDRFQERCVLDLVNHQRTRQPLSTTETALVSS